MKGLVGKFKSIDIYGHQIGVHYRGDGSYRTSLGSFFTLITVALVLSYTTIKVTDMVERTSQNEKTQTLKIDLDKSGKVNMAENNFTFGFYLTDQFNIPVDIPKRIGALKAYQLEYASTRFQRETELDVKLSTKDEIETVGVSERLAGLIKLMDFYYIDFTDANLQGTVLSEHFSFVQLRFEPCISTNDVEDCASLIEVNEYFENDVVVRFYNG